MVEKVYVGTGGWYDYRKRELAPGLRLKAYSKKFNFVEVNSTFYKILHPSTVERWRHQVPEEFEFSVKCYQALTHKIGIRPVEDAFKTINTMLSYCNVLNAKILVLETPASLLLNEKFVDDAKQFFNSLSLNNVRIAWEFRRRPQDVPDNLVDLMKELNMLYVVDMSWEDARYESDIAYTRIFGSPRNEFRLNNEDYETISTKITKSKSKLAYVTTHGLRMIQDAERISDMLSN